MDIYAQTGVTPLPVIQTARLELRPMVMADADAVTAQLNTLDVSRWLTVVPYPYTRDDAVWFINEIAAGRAKAWAIYKDDTLIGTVGGGSSHGYWLGQAYWGHGYATEAALAACGYHFDATEDAAITSEYFLGNAASQNVLRKIGFLPTDLRTTRCKATGEDVQAQGVILTRDRWTALHNA